MKMSELAAIAGVSKSTVSRALDDSSLVKDETKDLIRKLASKHGYKKDNRASNLRTKQVKTIGVILPSHSKHFWLPDNPFILELLGSISNQLDDRGHELLLTKHSSRDPAWLENYTRTKSLDGVIIIGHSIDVNNLNMLTEIFKNVVVWGAKISGQKFISVGTDNYYGGELVAKHLISNKRSKFCFLGDNSCPEANLRYLGYKETIINAGLKEPIFINSADMHDDNFLIFKQYFESSNGFDALFASNDMQAISSIQNLRSLGMSIPADVSVVGYDNINLVKYTDPTMTSVHQDRHLAGILLVEKLFALMENQKVESEYLPTELRIRASS